MDTMVVGRLIIMSNVLLDEPNETTYAAMEEETVGPFNTIDELMESLDA